MDSQGYIIDLGLIPYEQAWDLQHRLWKLRVEGILPDLLLVLEHPPVITLGRRGNRSHLIASQQTLEELRIPIFHVERGGDVTYHGPGQVVVYPILDLKGYGYRLIRYVDELEEVVIRVLKDFGIDGRRDPLNRGVWVGEDKIASVGVTVKRWVSFHGLALNYETDLSHFELIRPCGLVGRKMTTMAKVLGRPVSRSELDGRIRFHFREVFERNWEEKKLEEILSSNFKGQMPKECQSSMGE
ncbi:MAG: lipoyl(octanoyl) transferase [Deltaproteobacteria bacterium RBG_13_52_11b]|nr:MAG: lipoyl(octanoyl) transferase [Deltaproteobacteria bacterium RBG_13_52_11b]